MLGDVSRLQATIKNKLAARSSTTLEDLTAHALAYAETFHSSDATFKFDPNRRLPSSLVNKKENGDTTGCRDCKKCT